MNVIFRQWFLLAMFGLFALGITSNSVVIQLLICPGAIAGAIWVLFFAKRNGR